MTAAVLPIIAVNLQNFTPLVIGLIPIPYANFIGIAIGYCFSAFFLWLAILLGISRQQFGSAVEATAGLIPVVGPTAMNWVAKANFTAAKLNARRKKVMESISQTLEAVSGFVDATLTPALQTLDSKVQEVAQQANAVKGQVQDVGQMASDLKDVAKSKISDLKNSTLAKGNLDSLKSTGFNKLNQFKPGAARKKLTRRKNKKKQWRTTRKSRTI